MKYINNISIIIVMIALLISCKRPLYSDSETVLARVGDVYLDIADLTDNLPTNISKTDSVQMINSMIDNWVKQELMLQHANSNLPDSLKNF
ncbi:MAG: hypothetical protein GQ527_11930, partial [Bacteroidales bacterium]|nr:hypothetical protein [Bacteroidales bacterium]